VWSEGPLVTTAPNKTGKSRIKPIAFLKNAQFLGGMVKNQLPPAMYCGKNGTCRLCSVKFQPIGNQILTKNVAAPSARREIAVSLCFLIAYFLQKPPKQSAFSNREFVFLVS
jgi:hypothetical protein